MTDRNLGRFTIPGAMIREQPERIAEVFALLKLVPVRCEFLYHQNAAEYIAISERFPEVPTGMIIPEYQIKISQDEDGRVNLVEVIAVK